MYMDRFQQKAQNCAKAAARQAKEAAAVLDGDEPLTDVQIDPQTGEPVKLLYTAEQRLEAGIALLQSAIDNARRAKNALSGRPLDDVEAVREFAKELERDEPHPATWHDVANFILHLSRPRLKRAWNMAMVVLTEGA